MRSFIVPPPCECGWRIIATGARGRGAGEKRPSRRPSGPGKMTDGIGLSELSNEMLHVRGWRAEVGGYIGSRAFYAIPTDDPHLSRSRGHDAAAAQSARSDAARL